MLVRDLPPLLVLLAVQRVVPSAHTVDLEDADGVTRDELGEDGKRFLRKR